jgi:hypothetical protein
MSLENSLREKKSSTSESSEGASSRQSIANLVNRIVDQDWLNRVDNIVGYNAFISAAQRQWRSLDQDGTGHVSFDAFVKGIQRSLAELWNENLRPAAEALYGKARDIFGAQASPVPSSDTKSSEAESPTSEPEHSERKSSLLQFKDLWQAKIIALWKAQVVSPGLVVFNRALNFYLDAKNRLSSAKEFVEGMRLQLGHLWDDKLDQPLREFYNGAKQATREDLIQLRTQLQTHVLSTKENVRSKVTSIRSRITEPIYGLIDFVLGIFTMLVRVVFPKRVATKQEQEQRHTQEQQGEQEQENQEREQEREKEQDVEPKVHNTILSRAAKRAQVICDWGVGTAEQILPSRVFALGKDVYTGAEGVVKPRLNILIEKLQQIDSRLQLTERLDAADQGARPLVNKGLRYIKTTRKRDMIKDYIYFVWNLRSFMFQVVGFYPSHSSHFDSLATDLNHLFTNIIWIRGANKHGQDHAPQSYVFQSRQAGES